MHLAERATVHDRYLALSSLKDHFEGSFSGKLLLSADFDPAGQAAVIAASIAGLASVSLSRDPECLREGLRAGFCDFVVSHLDESLRILKNELRRGRSVAVALTAEWQPSLREMLERGLQPDVVVSDSAPSPEIQPFLDRGAVVVPQETTDPALFLLEWTGGGEMERSIPPMAGEALDPGRSDTLARRRWLEQSPALLRRSFGPGQCLRMTTAEVTAFRASLTDKFPSVSLHLNGAALRDV
jgi:hypothetical protein